MSVPLPIVAALIVAAIGSLLLGAKSSKAESLRSLFWADRQLGLKGLVTLLVSSSFSVNGILYQAFLGYSFGWAAMLIQVIWCIGYLLMARCSARIVPLLEKGTLHGVISNTHGPVAGVVAALLSVIGFGLLIGWEFRCTTSILEIVTHGNDWPVLMSGLVLVIVAATYSALGGLRSNARANEWQNMVAAMCVVVGIIYLSRSNPTASVKPSLSSVKDMIGGLGGAGFFANIVFSLIWQFCDMSNWQGMSSLGVGRARLSRGLWAASLGVLIAPGLIGTLLGIYMSGRTGVSDSTILSEALTVMLASHAIVAFLFCVGLFCAMLSTLDGYFLATSQSLVWDILKRSEVRALISVQKENVTIPEERIVKFSRVVVFMVGGGALMSVYFLHDFLGIGLFRLVYVVTVSQLALFGAVISCIYPRGKLNGLASLLVGVAVGGTCLAVGIAAEVQWLVELSSTFAAFGSLVGLLVPSPYRTSRK